jgi:hypothetical protein
VQPVSGKPSARPKPAPKPKPVTEANHSAAVTDEYAVVRKDHKLHGQEGAAPEAGDTYASVVKPKPAAVCVSASTPQHGQAARPEKAKKGTKAAKSTKAKGRGKQEAAGKSASSLHIGNGMGG